MHVNLVRLIIIDEIGQVIASNSLVIASNSLLNLLVSSFTLNFQAINSKLTCSVKYLVTLIRLFVNYIWTSARTKESG